MLLSASFAKSCSQEVDCYLLASRCSTQLIGYIGHIGLHVCVFLSLSLSMISISCAHKEYFKQLG